MFDVIEVHTDLPGYLFRPNKEGAFPGIVFLHGSDGGSGNFWTPPGRGRYPSGKESITVRQAEAFTRRGYCTLALSYFDCPHTKELAFTPPEELVQVDIKHITERALARMRDFEFVDERSVGICGASRGAEHALVMASLVKKGAKGAPDYVMSISPTAYIYGGISKELAQVFSKGESYTGPILPSWSYDGVDLIPGEIIAFEKIQVPFLITVCSKDPIWETEHDILDIKNRLLEKGVRCVAHELAVLNSPKFSTNKDLNHIVNIPVEGHCYPDPSKHPELMERFKTMMVEFVALQSRT